MVGAIDQTDRQEKGKFVFFGQILFVEATFCGVNLSHMFQNPENRGI